MQMNAALMVFTALAAFGQSGFGQSTAPPPAFDVASIKPADPSFPGMRVQITPGGTLNATNVTVKLLIQQAYDVRDFQISGGPGWLSTERYVISAKMDDSSSAAPEDPRKMTDEQRKAYQEGMRLKLRALLEDRFQLKVHRETKEMPIYALIVAKNGAKVQEAKDDGTPGGGISMGLGQITGKKVELAFLAQVLSNQVGRTVLDKTELKGNFDFKLQYTPDQAQQPPGPGDGGPDRPRPVDPDGPSIFTAVQEQLGLKLDAQKGPVEIVVIDGVEKASEN
jgi:bla regulator protein BlaR1